MGRPKGSKNKKTLEREINGGKPVTSKKVAKAGKARTFKYAAKSSRRDDDKKADIALDALVRIADALEGLDLGKQFPKFLELLPKVVSETRAVFNESVKDEDDTPHACDGTHGDAHPHTNGKIDPSEAAK